MRSIGVVVIMTREWPKSWWYKGWNDSRWKDWCCVYERCWSEWEWLWSEWHKSVVVSSEHLRWLSCYNRRWSKQRRHKTVAGFCAGKRGDKKNCELWENKINYPNFKLLSLDLLSSFSDFLPKAQTNDLIIERSRSCLWCELLKISFFYIRKCQNANRSKPFCFVYSTRNSI